MFLKKYWIPLSVFIVAIVGVGIYLLATQPPPDPIVTYTPVEPLAKPTEQPKTETPVVQETPDAQQGGHETHDPSSTAESSEPIPPVREVQPPTEKNPFSQMSVEEYVKKVTQEWENLPRDENGLSLIGLPDPPTAYTGWRNFEDVLKAGRVWHKLNAEEAKRLKAFFRQQRLQGDQHTEGGNIP